MAGADCVEYAQVLLSPYFVVDQGIGSLKGCCMMQFVQRCQDEADLAVKFFLSHDAYENELQYYQDPGLREIMVPVVHFGGNENGEVCTRSGYAFPPFIVVERGEVRNSDSER
jgi:hypothetical protein